MEKVEKEKCPYQVTEVVQTATFLSELVLFSVACTTSCLRAERRTVTWHERKQQAELSLGTSTFECDECLWTRVHRLLLMQAQVCFCFLTPG